MGSSIKTGSLVKIIAGAGSGVVAPVRRILAVGNKRRVIVEGGPMCKRISKARPGVERGFFMSERAIDISNVKLWNINKGGTRDSLKSDATGDVNVIEQENSLKGSDGQ